MAKNHWGLVLLLVYGVLQSNGSLIEFGDMIKELTGKTALPYYTSYGCHCGLGGKGEPLDATDRCCFAHDCCYGKLEDCNTNTDKYNYTIVDGNITCGTGSECEQKICDCDKTAANCFRDNLDSYNDKYTFHLDIHCKGKTMSC